MRSMFPKPSHDPTCPSQKKRSQPLAAQWNPLGNFWNQWGPVAPQTNWIQIFTGEIRASIFWKLLKIILMDSQGWEPPRPSVLQGPQCLLLGAGQLPWRATQCTKGRSVINWWKGKEIWNRQVFPFPLLKVGWWYNKDREHSCCRSNQHGAHPSSPVTFISPGERKHWHIGYIIKGRR